MSIAEFSMRNHVISWFLTILIACGGIAAYFNLGQLEDPEFSITEAIVVTAYPGSTPMEVEEELTYPLEKAIRQLPYVDHVSSISTAGLSQIIIELKPQYQSHQLPQIWDELRRKVNDLTPQLPPGVHPPQVMDDFGDVYGIMLMLTGKDFSLNELKQYADILSRELELVDGVGKVSIDGHQQEQLIVESSWVEMATYNINPAIIRGLISHQNAVTPSGQVTLDGQRLIIHPSGELSSIETFENLIIHGEDTGKLIRLRDIATVKRGLQEIPSHLVNYNGEPALAVGISFSSGVNVVEITESINQKLIEIAHTKPAGIELHRMYDQGKEVKRSVSGFTRDLFTAIGIVIVVLLFTMGIRSGLLIGAVLLLTILGTFILMMLNDIALQRISLGALIISLGMLVDNAIVVVDGILIGIQRGKSKKQAAADTVKQTQWPLLGATIIAIAAFAPIGLSEDVTGEYISSLFWLLLFSLSLSWIIAISLTPFLANLVLNEHVPNSCEAKDPYRGLIYRIFSGSLKLGLRYRFLSISIMAFLLACSIIGFGYVKSGFFPPSNTPLFFIDLWMPEGTDIRETYKRVQRIEKQLLEKEQIEFVSSSTGRGLQRFTLTYAPEKTFSAYAQIQVRTLSRKEMLPFMEQLREELRNQYPDSLFKFHFMALGPSPSSKIEARVIGSDPNILRHIAAQVEDIFNADPGSQNVTHNWRQHNKVLTPVFNESQARRLAISKEDLSTTLQMNFGGIQVGMFRDKTQMLPIIIRSTREERHQYDSIENIKIWSPALQSTVPIQQVIEKTEIQWHDPIIHRRDRKRTLTVQADHDIFGTDTAAGLLSRVKEKVEAIPLPPGYIIEWGGEYEASQYATEAVIKPLPLGYLVMFVITVLLFNSFRQTLVLWITVPLAIVGVTFGLLITQLPFSFTALLGLLSLSGMVLKNGIVLLDQTRSELETGATPYEAIVKSTISRVRPVTMAALTTMLGMLPLLFDNFFNSMAVTIIFGLGFATLLTLGVIPIVYAICYKIKAPKPES